MAELTLEAIEARRIALGVPVARLARLADVHEASYSRGRRGEQHTRPETLAALDLALKRIARNAHCDASERARLIDLVLRALSVLMAEMQDRHPLLGDRWARRRAVMGLANSGLGLPAAQLAAADGVSRAAMSYRLRDHEDARDDAAFDALMERLEAQLRGI